jgi:hypothetical protein
MKRYSFFILFLFFFDAYSVTAQKITKKTIIETLSGKTGKKAWFITGTTANTPDRVKGDMKYVFEKTHFVFKTYRCNQTKGWVLMSSQRWEILDYDPDSKSPSKYDLKIQGNTIYYNFMENFKKLYLQLKGWESPKILL